MQILLLSGRQILVHSLVQIRHALLQFPVLVGDFPREFTAVVGCPLALLVNSGAELVKKRVNTISVQLRIPKHPVAHPTCALHELNPVLGRGRQQCLTSTELAVGHVEVADQVLALDNLVVVDEHRCHCLAVLFVLLPAALRRQLLALDDPLQLVDRDVALVADSGDLTQLAVLEHSVCLAEEVVDQKGQLVARFHVAGLLAVVLDQSVDLRRHRFILDVVRILLLERGPVSRQQAVLALARQLRWVLTQAHESRLVHLSGNPLTPSHFRVASLLNVRDTLCFIEQSSLVFGVP